MASVLNTPAATVTGATTSQSYSHTTDGDTDDLAVCIFNSHDKTVSSVTFDGAALGEVVTDIATTGRASIWRLNAAPGAKTATLAITYSGTANVASVPVNI